MYNISATMDSDDLYPIVKNMAIEDIRMYNNLPEDQEINPGDFKQDYLDFADRRAREYVLKLYAEKGKNNVHNSTTNLVICYENLMRIFVCEIDEPEDPDVYELTF